MDKRPKTFEPFGTSRADNIPSNRFILINKKPVADKLFGDWLQ
jgi:hypothetical protein